jgi:hypothetical protein
VNAQKRYRASVGTPELEIAVAAAVPIVPARYGRPAMIDPFDVSHEMAMVKSALLYGDRVSVASWRVSMVYAWTRMRESRRAGDAVEVLRLLGALEWARARQGAKEPNPVLAALAEIPADDLTLSAIDSTMGGRLREVDVLLDAAISAPSWRELIRAVELGVVEIRAMGDATGFGFSREAAIAEYLRLIADLTDPRSTATPMLDYSSAGVLEVGTDVGLIKPGLPNARSEVALAAHYVGYLPAVTTASLEAVLTARDKLKGPLLHFRSVMAELAREIEVSPTQPGFDRAADELFRREVAPQLHVITGLSQERGLRRVIGQEVAGSQGGAVTKAVIGLAAGSVAGLPAIAQAALAGMVVAGEIASGAYKRRKQLDAERTANRLFWMYELERQLSVADQG